MMLTCTREAKKLNMQSRADRRSASCPPVASFTPTSMQEKKSCKKGSGKGSVEVDVPTPEEDAAFAEWESKTLESLRKTNPEILVDFLTGRKKTEAEFLQRNKGAVQVVECCSEQKLGKYHCDTCDTVLTTSPEGMERHIANHSNFFCTKIYFSASTGTYHPREQYSGATGFFPAPGAKLDHFCIEKVKYSKGSTWTCPYCNEEMIWGSDFNGQRASGLIKKIEAHMLRRVILGRRGEESL